LLNMIVQYRRPKRGPDTPDTAVGTSPVGASLNWLGAIREEAVLEDIADLRSAMTN